MLGISEKEMNQSCTQRHGQISEVILREKSKSQSNTYQKIVLSHLCQVQKCKTKLFRDIYITGKTIHKSQEMIKQKSG